MAEGHAGPASSLIGAILKGSYRIERLIGEGGMGVVYEAAHTRLPRRFAVKLLHGTEALDTATRERFRREAFVASAIGHRNICEVLDFDAMADGTLYMVMEYLEGESLARRISRLHGLSPATTLWVARQVSSALDVAHARGIVHRDLKPENVFLCREADGAEIVKLLDFGISKLTFSPLKLTHSAFPLGTPHCMSPEQARGEGDRIDARTDVFALGVMVFEMLAGCPPFTGDTAQALLYQVVYEPAPSLRGYLPALPAAIDEVLGRALAKERDQRYSSAGGFVNALARLLEPLAAVDGEPTDVAPRPAPAAVFRPSRPSTPGAERSAARWVLAIALGCSVAAVAVFASVSWRHGRPQPSPVPAAALRDTVEIRVDVTPRAAVVRWDGRPVTGPAWRAVADGRAHRLEIDAPGRQPLVRQVVSDHDQTIVVALALAVDAGPSPALDSPTAHPPPALRPPANAPAPPRAARRDVHGRAGPPSIIQNPNDL